MQNIPELVEQFKSRIFLRTSARFDPGNQWLQHNTPLGIQQIAWIGFALLHTSATTAFRQSSKFIAFLDTLSEHSELDGYEHLSSF